MTCQVSYVTLWDCVTGEVKRRLKRKTDVCALGITNDATRVVIGKVPNQVYIWDPMKSNSLRRARGYDGLRFDVGSKIFVQDDVSRAVVFAGDISMWVSIMPGGRRGARMGGGGGGGGGGLY